MYENDTEGAHQLESGLPGLAPWQNLKSGHASVDLILPDLLQARSVQLRIARAASGATSDSYDLVEANAQDTVVLYFSTFETESDSVRAMGLQQAAKRNLAKNVRIKDILGGKVAKIAKAYYKGITTAQRRGTNLPGLIVVDRLQDLVFPEVDPVDSGAQLQAAFKLLAALGSYDLDTIGALTGVWFEDWADEVAPNLVGRAAAVVGYLTAPPVTGWNTPERQPTLSDVPASWVPYAHSIMAIELFEATESEREGRFTALKQNMLTAAHPSVSIPLAFTGELGKRARFRDTLQDLLGE